MLLDLATSLLAACLVLVAPGYFWSRVLFSAHDWVERVAFTVGLSLTLVPATAQVLAALFGSGLTLQIAIASVAIVTLLGVLTYWKLGKAPLSAPVYKRELPTFDVVALLPLAIASVLMIAATVAPVARQAHRLAGPTAGFIILTALVQLLRQSRRREASPPNVMYGDKRIDSDDWVGSQAGSEYAGTAGPRWGIGNVRRTLRILNVRQVLLGVLVLLITVRGYLGPVRHDWPYIRGVDQYVHAVMVNLVLTEGAAESYSVYPPGFHFLTGVLSRLSGLDPIELFPFLAPALLLLPPLACYVLAQRVFGPDYSLPAAAFAGLVLVSPAKFLNDGTYVNIIAGEFLLVLTVIATVTVLLAPSWRSAALLALSGASVVQYHTITTLYLAVLLSVVSLFFLPYLLRKDRRMGAILLVGLALLGMLSVAFAWDTYKLPQTVSNLLGWSAAETDAASQASVVVGTQPPLPLRTVPRYLSSSVVQLGFLGFLMLALGLRRMQGTYRLAVILLLAWCALFFAGSRTSWSSFPWRFTRDLGVPLSILAAFTFMTLLRSFNRYKPLTVIAVFLASFVVVLQIQSSMVSANRFSRLMLMTPEVEAAGHWLRAHNEGGSIITNPVFNQPLLALGYYDRLPAVTDEQLDNIRGVPPKYRQQIEDVQWVYKVAGQPKTRQILDRYDVRYLVFVKEPPRYMRDKPLIRVKWTRYLSKSYRYAVAYENSNVIIFRVVDEE